MLTPTAFTCTGPHAIVGRTVPRVFYALESQVSIGGYEITLSCGYL